MVQVLADNFIKNMNVLRLEQDSQFFINIVSLHQNNWSLQEIANSFSVSKSAVATWEKKGKKIIEDLPFAVAIDSDVPFKEKKELKSASKTVKKVQIDFPIEAQQRILVLTQVASKVSRNTPVDAPSRIAAKELEDLLAFYKEKGVSYSKLAAAAGVTRRAIAQRLDKVKKKSN